MKIVKPISEEKFNKVINSKKIKPFQNKILFLIFFQILKRLPIWRLVNTFGLSEAEKTAK
ncbi:hypothetical protein EAG08_05170 [Chryseobacterium sp. 3008163]|nr:hypothetical protein EAG08_05170 [Chryseobacterium sp. 3008163]